MDKVHLLHWGMNHFLLNKIAAVMTFALTMLCSFFSRAAEYEFDDAFLQLYSDSKIDVGRFKFGNPVEPGSYPVDVYLNARFLISEIIIIKKSEDDSGVCISLSLYNALGLREASLNEEALRAVKAESDCVEVVSLSPDIKATFSFSDQRLDIEVPQMLIQRTARGAVDPVLWDSGIPSMLLGYDANYYESANGRRESRAVYAGMQFGLNYGLWHFRHQGALSWSEDKKRAWSTVRRYLERDITSIRSRLTIGDAFTDGSLFDTFSFRGVQLRSDDSMWPDSQRGYAPVVRGVARTNARVEVWQNGVMLYNTTVNPGAFDINDLYPTGYGGDLDVRVYEADGSVNTFEVPWASGARLLRPGMLRYDLVAGELRNVNLSFIPYVVQGTLQYGLKNDLTLYGGGLRARDYSAVMLGSSVGTVFGAFALDVTDARTGAADYRQKGVRLRLSYSKSLPGTGSSLSVVASRSFSAGYLELQDGMKFNNAYRFNRDDSTLAERQKSRLSVTLNQGLAASWGQLYASGYIHDYWHKSGVDTQYQIGYSNNYKRLNYGLSVGRSRSISGQHETQYLLSFSLPLGRSDATLLSMDTVWQEKMGASSRVSLSGQSGEGSLLSWGLGANRDSQNKSSANASMAYRTPYALLKGSATKSNGYRSAFAGISGTAVAVADGVALSPYRGTTMAVISAPGARGAKVLSLSGVEVNSWGLAVMPWLRPYSMNTVGLDLLGLPEDVELLSSSKKVVPRAGSVVKVAFETRKGTSILIAASDAQGNTLPFGASVLDSKGASIGMVTQGGKIYARLPEGESILKVKWGESSEHHCTIDISALLTQRDIEPFSLQRCQ